MGDSVTPVLPTSESPLVYRTRSLFFTGEARLQAHTDSDSHVTLTLEAVLAPRLGPEIKYRMISLLNLAEPHRAQILEQHEWLRGQAKRHYRAKDKIELPGTWDPLLLFLVLPQQIGTATRFEETLCLFGKPVQFTLEQEQKNSHQDDLQAWQLRVNSNSRSADSRTSRLYLNPVTSGIEKIELQGLFGKSLVLEKT